MNTWIIAENDAISSSIEDALRLQGHSCPAANDITIEALPTELKRFNAGLGVFFVAVARLTAAHFETIRAIRAAISSESVLVAVSDAADQSAMLGAVRVGANDFLTLNDHFEEELSRLFSRIHLTRRGRSEKGHTVTVLPCQSPADANLVSLNLAAVFASRATACGLLDLHFQGGDLALLLKLTPRHTIVDLFTQQDTVDEPMLRQVVTTHDCGVQLLAGPASQSDLASIRPQACRDVISLAQRIWPAVLINIEDMRHAEQTSALSVSDDIVLTVRLDIASLHRANRYIDMLVENRISRDRVRVLALGAGHSGELPPAAVKKVLRVAEVCPIPDDPVAMIRSINLGNPLVLEQPNSKAAAALRQFAESLLGVPDSVGSAPKPLTTFKTAAALAANAIPFCR